MFFLFVFFLHLALAISFVLVNYNNLERNVISKSTLKVDIWHIVLDNV